ncbi:uncharacterized protein RB166_020897 [Leptodactylus fuscus]
MNLIDNLEQHLRGQIDKLEQLKLCAAEALGSNVNSIGFSYMEHNSADLRMGLVQHLDLLCDLNERVKSLEMGTTHLAQAGPKPRMRGSRRASGQHRTRPHISEDTQSELGWIPAWQRRNSDTTSEMSCAW